MAGAGSPPRTPEGIGASFTAPACEHQHQVRAYESKRAIASLPEEQRRAIVLAALDKQVVTANAYLGAFGIAAARRGAADGPPDAIRNDRAVAEAYLGTMHETEAVTA